MIERQGQSAKPADWLAKDAKLREHGGAVIVNALASQLIVAIERVNAAKRNFNSPGGSGQAVPRACMRATNCYL